jgi:hypothetical protein
MTYTITLNGSSRRSLQTNNKNQVIILLEQESNPSGN